MASIQDYSLSTETYMLYELWVILANDEDRRKFCAYYFFDISEAYVCYQEMLCELGTKIVVIDFVEFVEFESSNSLNRENARLLDSASIYETVNIKSLKNIMKDLETPVSDSDREKMRVSVLENDKKFSKYNPDTEVKRKELGNILRNTKDTENKRERHKYDK